MAKRPGVPAGTTSASTYENICDAGNCSGFLGIHTTNLSCLLGDAHATVFSNCLFVVCNYLTGRMTQKQSNG